MSQHPMHYKTIPAGETLDLAAFNLKDHDGPLTLHCDGTPDDPVIITGGPLTNGSLQLTGQHFIVTDLVITSGVWGCLRIVGNLEIGPQYTSDVRIENSTFEQGGAGIWLENAKRVTVYNNDIQRGKMVVDTPGGDDDFGAIGVMCSRGTQDITVNGNRFRDLVAPSSDYGTDGAGVEIFNASGGIVVQNNHMYNVITGLEIGGTGRPLSTVVFRGNKVYVDPQHQNTPSARPYTIHGAGNFGVDIQQVTLANNTFYNFTQEPYNTAKQVTQETGTMNKWQVKDFGEFLDDTDTAQVPEITLTPGQTVLVQAAGDDFTDQERQVITLWREGDLLGAIRIIAKQK